MGVRTLVGLGAVVVLGLTANLLYKGYDKWLQMERGADLSITVDDVQAVGGMAACRSAVDKVFDLATRNYWILKYLTPEEREMAKGILLHPYYESRVAMPFADPGNIDQYVKEAETGRYDSAHTGPFKGFYWQARWDALSVEGRRKLDWAFTGPEKNAINEVRELRESIKEMFFLEFNSQSDDKSVYTFQICNNRNVPLQRTAFWVSGFHRGGVTPQGLGRSDGVGSSSNFEYDQTIPPHHCSKFAVIGDYKIFDNYEVTSSEPLWANK